jgi:hypothetical protein
MAEGRTIMRIDALEKAIETVLQDRRIPKKLRTALAVCKEQRAQLNNREIGTLWVGQTGTACLLKTIRPILVEVCQPCDTRRKPREERSILNCEPATIEREIKICLWHNDESLDWSMEINGQRHEHVTSEIMEALVECALIVAQMSLTRRLTSRPQ